MLKNYTKIEVDENGNKNYLNDELKLHRLDGPAVEFKDGSKLWYIKGKDHRNIDPADELLYGTKYWYFINIPHRIGGSFAPYRKSWYIHGKGYTKEDYFNKVWDI